MSESSIKNPCLGRLVAGAQPKGPVHLGELVGAIEPWVHLQDRYECIFIIADAGIQNAFEHSQLSEKRDIYEMLADWLAAGISPNHSIIALESAIPERMKLAELLSINNKEKSIMPEKESVSVLTEAIQAVEMLLFKADVIPMTEDQPGSSLIMAQNLGFTFNQKYGEVFPNLKAQLLPGGHLLGLDGRPMQRAYDNLILVKEYDEETQQKIGAASIDTLIMYTTRFDQDQDRVNSVIERFSAGELNENELRKHVTSTLNDYLHSPRVKRDKWIANLDELEAILQVGARRARAIASETIAEVSYAMRRN